MDRLRIAWNSALERLSEMLAGLSSRDRVLLAGLVVTGVLVLLGGSTFAMSGAIKGQRNRLDERQRSLAEVSALASAHTSRASELAEIEQKIREHASTDLQAFLEQAGNRVGISDRLDAVREKSSTTELDLEDKLYTVTLSNLTLEEYSSFLYEIESVGYPLKVRSTKVRVRLRGPDKMLMVDMDISAFRLVDAATGEG